MTAIAPPKRPLTPDQISGLNSGLLNFNQQAANLAGPLVQGSSFFPQPNMPGANFGAPIAPPQGFMPLQRQPILPPNIMGPGLGGLFGSGGIPRGQNIDFNRFRFLR